MKAPVSCSLCSLLGLFDEDFLPNTDEAKKDHARIHFAQSKILDDKMIELEIFQQCFANGPLKPERPALSRSECHRSLLILCKSLLPHESRSAKAVCNMCGSGISTKNTNRNMLNHACAHLEDKLFQCRHCDCFMSSGRNMLQHIRRMHNIKDPTNEDFEDKTVENFSVVSHQIKRCFSTNYPSAQGQFIIRWNLTNKRQREVTDFCHSIFIQRSKPTSLECNMCGLRIKLRRRCFQAARMFEHAAAHLEVKLFTCHHCHQQMSCKQRMRSHLKRAHQITNGNNDDFDDQSEKFHSEYLAIIKRCFSARQIKHEVPSIEDQRMVAAEAAVRRRVARGSQLALQRHLFCNRIMRKSSDSDEKIKCSLCSKRLAVKFSNQTSSTILLTHAESHLQKPLYRCTVCKSTFSTRQTIACHLKGKHALGRKQNLECVADEFHEEFMAVLSKCYGA